MKHSTDLLVKRTIVNEQAPDQHFEFVSASAIRNHSLEDIRSQRFDMQSLIALRCQQQTERQTNRDVLVGTQNCKHTTPMQKHCRLRYIQRARWPNTIQHENYTQAIEWKRLEVDPTGLKILTYTTPSHCIPSDSAWKQPEQTVWMTAPAGLRDATQQKVPDPFIMTSGAFTSTLL